MRVWNETNLALVLIRLVHEDNNCTGAKYIAY